MNAPGLYMPAGLSHVAAATHSPESTGRLARGISGLALGISGLLLALCGSWKIWRWETGQALGLHVAGSKARRQFSISQFASALCAHIQSYGRSVFANKFAHAVLVVCCLVADRGDVPNNGV